MCFGVKLNRQALFSENIFNIPITSPHTDTYTTKRHQKSPPVRHFELKRRPIKFGANKKLVIGKQGTMALILWLPCLVLFNYVRNMRALKGPT